MTWAASVRRYLIRKRSKWERDRLLNRIVSGRQPRDASDKRPSFSFIIDVLGVCNLRCPSCPTGNWEGGYPGPKDLMSPEMLTAILDKAERECEIKTVSLYNWTEPVLHPKLPELIRIVQSRHVPCTLSSNLNLLRNPDDIMAAEPYQFHISVSGFSQETYGYTHRGGNVERVKENMAELAAARQRVRSGTYVKVIFHRYVNNAEDEMRMKEFAEDLGFRFEPNWAILMPLEKSMALVDPAPTGVRITDEDRSLVERLAVDVRAAYDLGKKDRKMPCPLRDGEFTLDCAGNVLLCCGVYDTTKYSLGNFLTEPLADLHAKKYKSAMCGKCISLGGHVYLTHRTPEFDALGNEKRRQLAAVPQA